MPQTTADAYAARGLRLFEEGRYADARKDLEAAVKLDRTQVEALILLVRIHLIEKDYDGAADLLIPLAQSPSADAESRMLLAYTLEKKGDFRLAAALLELSIDIITWGGDATYAAAARARIKLGDYERAATLCERGMESSPNSDRLLRVYASLPADVIGKRIADRLAKLSGEKDGGAARIVLGRILSAIDAGAVPNARESATRLLAEAAAREPENISAQYNLGRFERLAGHTVDAKRSLEKALSLNPDDDLRTLIQTQLALAELASGDDAAAEQAYRSALDSNRRSLQASADAALEYVRFLKLRSRDEEAKKLLSEISRWDLGAAEEFLASSQAAPPASNR
jgi:tetratricopeptide (TPR) repeat protein